LYNKILVVNQIKKQMKKSLLTMAALAFMMGALLPGCTTAEQRVKDAEEDVVEANEALEQANADYLADMEKFRQEAEERTITNDQMIAEFRSRIATEKASVRASYEKKIASLEESNARLKQRMADYKEDGSDNWYAFKHEFNRDMNELGKALADFTKSNTK
jgi:hypothetical protein